jgi:hypothetical protein
VSSALSPDTPQPPTVDDRRKPTPSTSASQRRLPVITVPSKGGPGRGCYDYASEAIDAPTMSVPSDRPSDGYAGCSNEAMAFLRYEPADRASFRAGGPARGTPHFQALIAKSA